jgi:hypothetical protein
MGDQYCSNVSNNLAHRSIFFWPHISTAARVDAANGLSRAQARGSSDRAPHLGPPR